MHEIIEKRTDVEVLILVTKGNKKSFDRLIRKYFKQNVRTELIKSELG